MARPDRLTLFFDLVAALMLAGVGGLYLVFDKVAAISLYPIAIAFFCALALVASLPLLYGRRRTIQIAIPIVIVLLALAVQFINWDSRKPFMRALNQIEAGMTVEQVDAMMAGYMRSPAQSGSVGETNAISFRHTNEGWGNNDIGLITFVDGHVASREFVPD